MQDLYKANGYADRKEYLTMLAEEYGVSQDKVFATADLLGPNEDFDGLVTILQDYANDF
jgi:hypothetical protein